MHAPPCCGESCVLAITGVIPFGETIFLWQSIALTAVLIAVSVLIAWLSAPGAAQVQTVGGYVEKETVVLPPLMRFQRPSE